MFFSNSFPLILKFNVTSWCFNPRKIVNFELTKLKTIQYDKFLSFVFVPSKFNIYITSVRLFNVLLRCNVATFIIHMDHQRKHFIVWIKSNLIRKTRFLPYITGCIVKFGKTISIFKTTPFQNFIRYWLIYLAMLSRINTWRSFNRNRFLNHKCLI